MKRELREIPVLAIHPDENQPRKDFDEDDLLELTRSIQRNGLLQPISVTPNSDGFIIIAGERRWRAVQALEWETMPAIVITFPSNGNEKAKALQLIENIHRRDLNPVEVAQGYQNFIDRGYSKDEVADILGTTKSVITWQLGLLKCEQYIQHLIARGHLATNIGVEIGKLTTNGQNRAIRTLNNSHLTHHEQIQLCQHLYAEENALEMFKEAKLTPEQVELRRKAKTTIDYACQAINTLVSIP